MTKENAIPTSHPTTHTSVHPHLLSVPPTHTQTHMKNTIVHLMQDHCPHFLSPILVERSHKPSQLRQKFREIFVISIPIHTHTPYANTHVALVYSEKTIIANGISFFIQLLQQRYYVVLFVRTNNKQKS